MICKKPFILKPVGISQKDVLLSEDARMASTPFPCGKCLHCRINKSREWKFRIILESLCYENNCFVTLTYDDEHIPRDWNLSKEDYQNFLKLLRYNLPDRTIRYFIVGEYGNDKGRPHYHAILFNVGMHEASAIRKAWGKGFIHVGEVNKDTASYVTSYVTKGWTLDNVSELKGRTPEFMRSSKGSKYIKGGLGAPALNVIADRMKRFGKDIGVIKELRVGKKTFPLGGYLSKKLSKMVGNEDVYDLEFYERQNEVFEKFMVEGENFLDNIIKHDYGKRIRNEKRHKLFKQRRTL